jgi:CheY-like chemotaxis protein
MAKNCTASHSLSRPSTGDIRKATFDQRKSGYVRSTHDRPAVFIEQSIIHNDLCVLLIDDDPIALDALSELLVSEKYKLYTAKDRTEGLNKIANGVHPNIVIIDVRWPNKTGVETVERIRRFTGEEIPVIMFTDDTYDEEIEADNLNKCIVLHKPQDVNTLSNRIDEMAA